MFSTGKSKEGHSRAHHPPPPPTIIGERGDSLSVKDHSPEFTTVSRRERR